MFSRLVIAAGTAVVAILRAVGRVLYEPDDGERVSTWSIRKRDARTFYLLLAGLWMGAAAALAWGQYDDAPPRVVEWALLPPHAGDGSVYAVAQRFGALVIPLMAAALLLTPAVTGAGRFLMTIARFINEKILDPFIEAKAIAPRMVAREEELQARLRVREDELQAQEEEMQAREDELRSREMQTREVELRTQEEELRAQEMQVRSHELQVRSLELQVREEELQAQESELQARLTAERETRLAAEVARTDEQWACWLARRDAALAQGQAFDEPRPDEVRG